ncbi:hypothetical protein JCM33374_g17 [Metschnikowia sp. JCM 33374]|nr:hypothetical protein JCM33374_g17 [Metschnikowia sp. JCM 33374]
MTSHAFSGKEPNSFPPHANQANHNASEPPENLPPSYMSLQPQFQTREFIFRLAGGRFKAFPSEKSMEIYENAKRLLNSSKSNPDFVRAKEYQNLSIGLPLLISRRSSSIGVYLKLLDCEPTPHKPDNLYCRNDAREVARVHRMRFRRYHQYVIPLENEEIVVFLHLRSDIADFKIGDQRFRFLKALSKSERPHTKAPLFYNIYLLDPHQPSLVDNMDSSLRVHKNNPLLEISNRKKVGGISCFAEREAYTSSCQYGYLEGCRVSHRNKKCATLGLIDEGSGNRDSNDSVDFKSFVFVVVSHILQNHEQDLERSRASRSANISNNSMMTSSAMC